ncbi:MAG: PAS domain-containing protein [Promethearchaeota archaeon]
MSENADDLIAVFNKNLEHEYINEIAYEQILGYSNIDIIGKSALNFIHPDDVGKSKKIFFEIFKKGEGKKTRESRLKHKNGQSIWFESKGIILKEVISVS